MKVTAFVGSARKKHTYHAAERLLKNLESPGKIDCEIVQLSDYHLETCRGCKTCFEKGEEWCPLHDDRDRLIQKIDESDGIIFASPNYSFHVSGSMKVFLDRLGFLFHRPRFFGKAYTSIVAQGVMRGEEIVKYFDFIGKGLGFNVVKGCCIRTLEPMTEEGKIKTERILDRLGKKFHSTLEKKALPAPSFFKLMIFRLGRTSIKKMLDDRFKDFRYYQEQGWFRSDYFYPVKLNLVKKLAGLFFDRMGARMAGSN
jgi:multimeric flavodoxin WrbA